MIHHNDGLSISPVGISSTVISSSPVSVYPNPVSSELHLEFSKGISNENLTIQLIDINGKILKEEVHTRPQSTSINVEEIPNGLYFIRIVTPQGIYTEKVLKGV